MDKTNMKPNAAVRVGVSYCVLMLTVVGLPRLFPPLVSVSNSTVGSDVALLVFTSLAACATLCAALPWLGRFGRWEGGKLDHGQPLRFVSHLWWFVTPILTLGVIQTRAEPLTGVWNAAEVGVAVLSLLALFKMIRFLDTVQT